MGRIGGLLDRSPGGVDDEHMAQGAGAVRAAIMTYPPGCISGVWPSGIGLVATVTVIATIFYADKLRSKKCTALGLLAMCFLYLPLLIFLEKQECKQEPVFNLEQIEAVENSIRLLNAHDIVLVGHSSGGQIAAMVALRGKTPHIRTVIGVAGVYDLVSMHESRWPLNIFFDYMYLAPVFSLSDLAPLSPQQALASNNCRDEAPLGPALTATWWIVSGRYDHDILIHQADRFYDALYQSGATVSRVRAAS